MKLLALGSFVVPLLLAPISGCGDAPRPVADDGARVPAAPKGFAGRAILKGELADVETGSLMISAFPKGVRMPLLAMKVALDDPRIVRHAEHERVLEFRLDASTSLIPGDVPEGVEFDLEVRFDRDGFVETKEGDVAAMVAARSGVADLVVVLPPEPAQSGTRSD